jgi:hypothetical protein
MSSVQKSATAILPSSSNAFGKEYTFGSNSDDETESSGYSEENTGELSERSSNSTSSDVDEESNEIENKTKILPQTIPLPTSTATSATSATVPQRERERQRQQQQQQQQIPEVPNVLPTFSKRVPNRELELMLLYKTLDEMPNAQGAEKSYFLCLNKDDVKLCPGKPKFPEGTCFGTTYANAKDYASFFLWKKCPYALSFYELISVPWKNKKEMIAFIKCKQELLDCYLSVLAKCSNCPTSDDYADFSSWDAFLHDKTRRIESEENENENEIENEDENENEIPYRRRYGNRRCRKECRGEGEEKEHHASCPNKCDNERRKKTCRKGKIYFSRKRCASTDFTSGEARYKYFLCVRGGAGPSIEKSIKDAVGNSPFDVGSYLELDKRACKTALCNNNRIAYGIAQLCNLNISHGFESPCDISEECRDSKFFPLIAGIPSFAQFYNRTLGMSSETLVSTSESETETNAESNFNRENDDGKWLLSYNGTINGKETASSNDGKIAIEIPSEEKIVMIPVDANANALSFLIPSCVGSIKDIETKRKELCAVHSTEEEIRSFDRFVKSAKTGSSFPNKIGNNATDGIYRRPSILKIYDLYEVS